MKVRNRPVFSLTTTYLLEIDRKEIFISHSYSSDHKNKKPCINHFRAHRSHHVDNQD
ncbi:Uncharacterised protein [Serratia rubidaea]|uniref:Uncharacterized protein n=1 Tax=Serratia rubidaea TaxID=61652 RepID=A0A3S4GFE9_SERRU|nr:Uncharacterised protein [Serratia rubidaea]